MIERIENDHEVLTLEMFNKSLNILWTKKGNKYDFLMRAGHDYKEALFSLFQKVWYEEQIPTGWTKTSIIQIFKGKGDFQDQSSQRFIHTIEITPKVFSHILVESTKDTLMKNMSKFQIGAKPGHRATEHIFVMKSLIQLYEYLEKPLIINFFDYSTFFDSESLQDVLNELYKCQVKGKIYRLLYKLNQKSLIHVKTPVGATTEEEREEGISQGNRK